MDTICVLAQDNPTADILTTLYTVPASTSTVVSSIIVCNLDVVSINFSISVAVGGASNTPAQYIYYQVALDVNDTFIATVGLSLATTDVIRVWSSSSNVAFNIFGDQIT